MAGRGRCKRAVSCMIYQVWISQCSTLCTGEQLVADHSRKNILETMICSRSAVPSVASLESLTFVCTRRRSVSMSGIMGYNGSAMVAMAGKNCVAIAADRRYGVQVC